MYYQKQSWVYKNAKFVKTINPSFIKVVLRILVLQKINENSKSLKKEKKEDASKLSLAVAIKKTLKKQKKKKKKKQ